MAKAIGADEVHIELIQKSVSSLVWHFQLGVCGFCKVCSGQIEDMWGFSHASWPRELPRAQCNWVVHGAMLDEPDGTGTTVKTNKKFLDDGCEFHGPDEILKHYQRMNESV